MSTFAAGAGPISQAGESREYPQYSKQFAKARKAIHATTVPSRWTPSEGERRTPARVRRNLRRTMMSHYLVGQVARH